MIWLILIASVIVWLEVIVKLLAYGYYILELSIRHPDAVYVHRHNSPHRADCGRQHGNLVFGFKAL